MTNREWRRLAVLPILMVAALLFSCQGRVLLRLEDMPPVLEVLAKVRGTDAVDSAARQSTVLSKLILTIGVCSANRTSSRLYTADEQKLVYQYSKANTEVQTKAVEMLQQRASPGTGPSAAGANWNRILAQSERSALPTIESLWPEVARAYQKGMGEVAKDMRADPEKFSPFKTVTFDSEKSADWRNVIWVAAMVGVAILLLERWVSSVSKSRLSFPPKERILSKVTGFYWIAAVLFDLSTAFVILTNFRSKNTIIYGNSVPIAVTVLGLSIGAGAFLDRHRRAFLRAVRKRYAEFRASVGSAEHQAYVLGTAIAVDKAKMKVSLLDDENSKTYDFSEVRGWECRFERPGFAYGPSSADVRAINQQMAVDAQDRSGLFFNVKDVAHPVWHIRVYEKPALDRWHEILRQAMDR